MAVLQGVGARLLQARLWQGWSQAELAEEAGTRPATISAIERGESSGRRVLDRLANALGVPTAWLRLGVNPPAWVEQLPAGEVQADGPGPLDRPAADRTTGRPAGATGGAVCLGSVDERGRLRPGLEHIAGLGEGLSCLRAWPPAWCQPLAPPALLLVDQVAMPRPGQLAVQWLDEQQLALVRHVPDTGGEGFALIPADGSARASIYREGEEPLRLLPVVGVVEEPRG